MHVEVVYALPDAQHRVHLELAEGATVAEALSAIRPFAPFAELDFEELDVGVYGRIVARNERLHHGDRLEIYRSLLIDPKDARRRRAAGDA